MSKPAPLYARLGQSIADARRQAGHRSQGDFAGALGVSQQSVSRWEAGTHRPSIEQMPALATALGLRRDDLLEMAGYGEPSAAAFITPLPVDKLDPVTFELFTRDLVQYLHPNATVRRAGEAGHTQDGYDVYAIDRRTQARTDYQCKRVAQFGKAEAARAVAAYKGSAQACVLVLSRVASPQLAAAIETYPGWEVWDRDDISGRFRTLPVEHQDQIVDLYFPGQRRALLGRDEPGPWQTVEQFFRPFRQTTGLFNHNLDVVGREAELDALADRLVDRTALVILSAPGGMGKSRILMEAAERYAQDEPAVTLRFLNGAADPRQGDLADLGPGPKLIVVDDAHDRDGLGQLFQFVAASENQACLLLASRPYALDRLRREAAVFGLASPPVITMADLNGDDLRALARRVLEALNLSEDWTDDIVQSAGGSPLVISMLSRILARDPMSIEKARHQGGLRDFILGKFADVAAGRLGPDADRVLHRKVLDVLAVVQPFQPDDPRLFQLLEDVQGVTRPQAEEVMRNLLQGGVAFRRGANHRLMPDLLGDYLIDQSCVTGAGRLSAFAVSILDAADPTTLARAIVNLGRLDWRRSDGETADSDFLAEVWSRLRRIENDHDDRLDAVKAVAIFQPRQALEFAIHMAGQQRLRRDLPEILRNIAFSSTYLREVAELLWVLGRFDERPTGPNPGHAIRVLNELSGFDNRRPLEVNETILGFGLDLAGRDEAWTGAYTPLDVLTPFLATEGMTTRSDGRGVTMTAYELLYDAVEPFRRRVIEAMIALLSHPDLRIARRVALKFDVVLRGPMGMMGRSVSDASSEHYDREFAETIDRLTDLVRKGLPDLVTLALVEAVRWHAQHGTITRAPALALVAAQPDTLTYRTAAALSDGFGHAIVRGARGGNWQGELTAWIDGVVAAIETAHPDVEDRRAAIETALDRLADGDVAGSSAHVLINQLMYRDPAFALALVEDAVRSPGSRTAIHAAAAIGSLFRADPVRGREQAASFLASDRPDLRRSAAAAFIGEGDRVEPDDVDLVRRMLVDDDQVVVSHAVRAVWSWRDLPPEIVTELVLTANMDGDEDLIDSVAMALTRPGHEEIYPLTAEQAERFLTAAEPLNQLTGHWTDMLIADLSARHPRQTAAFFRRRVERAAVASHRIRVANYGPWTRSRLKFLESPEGAEVLRETWDWMRGRWEDEDVRYHAARLFEAMFLFDEATLVAFFDPILATATLGELDLISSVLRQARHTFIFDNADFVIRLMDRCQAIGPEAVEDMTSQLYAAAISGVRTGVPGQPMPRDIKDRDRATEILGRLSRLSPAWRLYDIVKRGAETGIAQSRREGEALDDL